MTGDEAVRKEFEFEDTPEFWKALAQRVIAGCRPGRNLPRWAVVSQRIGHGSTYSRDLCRYFGVDPDETLKRRQRLSKAESPQASLSKAVRKER